MKKTCPKLLNVDLRVIIIFVAIIILSFEFAVCALDETKKEDADQKLNMLEQKIDGITSRIFSMQDQLNELKRVQELPVRDQSAGNRGKRPNVIMVVSDTLRADHVSAINPRIAYRTPNIDRLARMGLLFTNAIAQAPHTSPAMTSIFTGLYPSGHKKYNGLLPIHRTKIWPDIPSQMGILGLFDRLREHGYKNFVISQNPQNANYPGMVFVPLDRISSKYIENPQSVIDNAIDFLKIVDSPFFLYLHILDPHNPHNNFLEPLEFNPKMCGDIACDSEIEDKLYSLEIQGVDRALGKFVDYLLQINYFKNGMLIFLGDHGEFFGERSTPVPYPNYPGHGADLYQELIRVPLITVSCETFNKGIRFDKCVETRALFSTIIEQTGARCIDKTIHPRSLEYIVSHSSEKSYCISEGIGNFRRSDPGPFKENFMREPFNIEKKVVISSDGMKLFHDSLHKTDLLYDLNKDPGELHPLPLDNDRNIRKALELKKVLTKRIDIDGEFIKPDPYENILSMPSNKLISGINASHNSDSSNMAYMLDNDPATYWQNSDEMKTWWQYPPGESIFVTLIYRDPMKVGKLIITPRQDNPQWFSKGKLWGSNDGYHWGKISDISVAEYSNAEKNWDVKVNKGYKYFKLEILEIPEANKNDVSIAEMKLSAEAK